MFPRINPKNIPSSFDINDPVPYSQDTPGRHSPVVYSFPLFLFPFICLFHPCLPVEVYLLTIKTYHCSIYQRTNLCHSHQLSTILCTQTVSVPLCLSSSSCQITMLLMLVVTNAKVLFQIVRYKFPLVRFSIECRETKAITLNSSITQSYSNQINMAGAKCGKKCTKDSRLVNWIRKLC